MDEENIRLRATLRRSYFPERETRDYGSAANFAATMRNYVGNSDYWAASYFRRISAEIIDFTICIFLKLFVVLALIELDLIDIEPYHKVIDEDHDIVEFILMTQALLPIEVFCKMLCAVLEALVMAVNIGPCKKGQTPGKWIVGIRVISAENIIDATATSNRYLIYEAKDITLRQSFTRALMKNMIMNSLFPLSTLAFNLNSSRSFYDSLIKTVVVAS
ncbi:unnamed protein product [Caenorhabditis bovis]|uniref:RDD domain-containing protein n=1 Tax=Caenorhabditis bovis TaxID=2654633 RepID=A0A8S1EJN3_9PELO|nr:unnamed protein product [Caenorhabditis bovis]